MAGTRRSLDSKDSRNEKKQKYELDLGKMRKRVGEMEQQRNPLLPTWQEIAKYISPGRGIFDQQEPNKGERKDRELLDSTPLQALHILSAGMQGGLTSPSRPWFKLGIADLELSDNANVRGWMDEVERRMIQVFSQSNLYNCLHTLYGEVGAFGIGALLVEADTMTVARGRTITVGEYYVSYSDNGLPSAFSRIFWMTPLQMAERFGIEALTESSRTSLENDHLERWVRVCHLVQPNVNYIDKSPLATRKRVMSVYWEEQQTEKYLSVSGYDQFPVMVPRWEVVGSDFYGRGPGWNALGESKTLQEMRMDYLIAQKMGIQPPLMAPLGMKKARGSLMPGDITYLAPDMMQGYRPIYEVRPDIPGQVQGMDDSRNMIRAAFFADLFLTVIASQYKDMTARQVEEMHTEKMMMIGPVLERLENELLDPLIGRVFALMNERGLIPEPPEELQGRLLEIKYISTLAQAQQMVGLSNIDKLTVFTMGLAQASPDAMDKLDMDEAIDQYSKMLGTPVSIIKSDEDVAAMREARAQQQQQMQEMAAAQNMAQTAQMGSGAMNQAAGAANSLSQAAAGGGLEQLAGMFGGEEM